MHRDVYRVVRDEHRRLGPRTPWTSQDVTRLLGAPLRIDSFAADADIQRWVYIDMDRRRRFGVWIDTATNDAFMYGGWGPHYSD